MQLFWGNFISILQAGPSYNTFCLKMRACSITNTDILSESTFEWRLTSLIFSLASSGWGVRHNLIEEFFWCGVDTFQKPSAYRLYSSIMTKHHWFGWWSYARMCWQEACHNRTSYFTRMHLLLWFRGNCKACILLLCGHTPVVHACWRLLCLNIWNIFFFYHWNQFTL